MERDSAVTRAGDGRQRNGRLPLSAALALQWHTIRLRLGNVCGSDIQMVGRAARVARPREVLQRLFALGRELEQIRQELLCNGALDWCRARRG